MKVMESLRAAGKHQEGTIARSAAEGTIRRCSPQINRRNDSGRVQAGERATAEGAQLRRGRGEGLRPLRSAGTEEGSRRRLVEETGTLSVPLLDALLRYISNSAPVAPPSADHSPLHRDIRLRNSLHPVD